MLRDTLAGQMDTITSHITEALPGAEGDKLLSSALGFKTTAMGMIDALDKCVQMMEKREEVGLMILDCSLRDERGGVSLVISLRSWGLAFCVFLLIRYGPES